MLVSLLGNNTWVWSNNCTNNVPGATNSSCAAPPVSVSPLFNQTSMTNTTASMGTYLGNVTGGGFLAEATSVNISTPCIGGLINNPNKCFDFLPAAMGWNITADTWLIN